MKPIPHGSAGTDEFRDNGSRDIRHKAHKTKQQDYEFIYATL